MKGLRTVIFIFAMFVFNAHYAQEQDAKPEEELSLDKGSISSQFDYLAKKGGNYRAEGKRYEVIVEGNLFKIRKNVLDSLKVSYDKISSLKTTISGHEATINDLNGKLENTTNNLSAVTEEKDSMSFLGMLVSKGTYNFILWSAIGALLLMLLFFIYKFRNSNILTQEAKSSLAELETEYEDHRRRALEREQKISRELQDEINKYRKSK